MMASRRQRKRNRKQRNVTLRAEAVAQAVEAVLTIDAAQTINELAKQTGVSYSTAQKALRQAHIDEGSSHASHANGYRKSVYDSADAFGAGIRRAAAKLTTEILNESEIAHKVISRGRPIYREDLDLYKAMREIGMAVEAILKPALERARESANGR